MSGKRKLPALQVGLLLLLCFAPSLHGAKASPQIESLAVSPDGKLVAVEVRQGSTSLIYKVAVDTGVATRLTNARAGKETIPAFSSNGKRIVYGYSPPLASYRVVVVNVDGSNPQQWSPAPDLSPVFSRDNKTIVFSRAGYYGSYSPIAQPHAHDWSIYASDVDGTNERRLTTRSFYMLSPISVSPDGKKIVVVTEGLETDEQIAIYSIDHPGPPLRTFQPHVPKEADRKHPIFADPKYLPDGTILFTAASKGKSVFNYDVYRLYPKTGAVEELTNGIGYTSDLEVSADGKTAVFLKWHTNWLGDLTSNELYLLDIQTHKFRPLEVNTHFR
jgi:Tol biopolymer transport system component